MFVSIIIILIQTLVVMDNDVMTAILLSQFKMKRLQCLVTAESLSGRS